MRLSLCKMRRKASSDKFKIWVLRLLLVRNCPKFCSMTRRQTIESFEFFFAWPAFSALMNVSSNWHAEVTSGLVPSLNVAGRVPLLKKPVLPEGDTGTKGLGCPCPITGLLLFRLLSLLQHLRGTSAKDFLGNARGEKKEGCGGTPLLRSSRVVVEGGTMTPLQTHTFRCWRLIK